MYQKIENYNMSEENKHNIDIEDRLEGESGLLMDETSSLDIYPNAEIRIIPAQYSVSHIYRLCEVRKELIIDPEFQRNSTWGVNQKSELVESILMGIPIPVIYLFESLDGSKQIIDGRQRISTIIDFLNNKFKLKNLKILGWLNNMYFRDIEPKLQGIFEDFQMSFYIIQPPTPERVKYDIFDRVNRGGTKLNSQEMRNALYQGVSTQLIKEIAESDEFKKVTGDGINPVRMRDRYVVLRSIAFYLYYTDKLKDPYTSARLEYRSDIDDFLAKTMIYLNRNIDNAQKTELVTLFKSAYRRIYNMFGDDAFRFQSSTISPKRRPINMPLMEVLTLIFLLGKEKDSSGRYIYKSHIERFKQELDYSKLCGANVDSRRSWDARISMTNIFFEEISKL